MGLFFLEGDAKALAPIAEKLGLGPCVSLRAVIYDAGLARWVKRFPRSRSRRRIAGGTPISPLPLRPYSGLRGPSPDERTKAVDYALWLARRDGIEIPERTHPEVEFGWVAWAGFARPVRQARWVEFSHVRVDIPHFGYDPTLPAVEESECELELAPC